MTGHGQVERIFHEARAIESPEQRQAYLRGACGSDAALCARVEALLAADAQAEQVFGATHDEAVAGRLPGDVATEQPGAIIGRYKLLQLIGEGGFGTVFMAQQREPVQRMVALKIIKLGMDTRAVVARFEQERQALAMMDHQNIAKVFDGGATASGRPYFVMELVKGEPITEYCDKNNLTVQERLELFIQVCRAVQHAHTKGIIHRDLKPGNVQVSMQDGRPIAKVIDFGIAKATHSRLTEKTLFTEFRQLVGTPEYMSPEQAEGSLDIDARTDVYSLGVLLYELLTGHTPFDKRNLRQATFGEIQRIIREIEPPRPSTRLSEDAQTLVTIASRRHIEPRKLSQLIRGDLDWVVMKCLEKDRSRRYDTTSTLARDLEYFLADEPITAGPPGRVYRLRKLARRNRSLFVGGGAVAAALVIGLGAALWGLTEARAQREQAVLAFRAEAQQRAEAEEARSAEAAQRQFAEHSLRRASALQEFLLNRMIRAADPDVAGGRELTVREVMDIAARNAATIDDPAVQAAVRHEVGVIYEALDLLEQAKPQLERALELREQLGEGARAESATTMLALARVLNLMEAPGRGQELARQARAIRADLYGEASIQTAEADLHLAEVLFRTGRDLDGAELAADILAQLDDLEKQGSESRLHADALALLGRHLGDYGDLERAAELLQRNLEIRRRLDGPESTGVASALLSLAPLLGAMGRLEEAEEHARESLEIRRRLLPENHTSIAQSLQELAIVAARTGRLEEAELLMRKALDNYRDAFGPGHEFVATTALSLGPLLAMQGKFADAAAMYEQAIVTYAALFGEEDWRLANARSLRGRTLLELEEYEEAEQLLLDAHRALVESGLVPEVLAMTKERLIELYERWGRHEEAASWGKRLDELHERNR